MGMYNEVYTGCPKCKTTTTAQITQIVLGFGEFDLYQITLIFGYFTMIKVI